MKKIFLCIEELLSYAESVGLMPSRDRIYCRNRLMSCLQIKNAFTKTESVDSQRKPTDILEDILNFALEKGLITGNTLANRDNFDTQIMNCIMPPPSVIQERFEKTEKNSGSAAATENYYNLSRASNYIRSDRIAKDRKWIVSSEYGDIQISINLSKPEKDPRDIVEGRDQRSRKYPKCLLCRENEGYHDGSTYPARDTHRVISLDLCGEPWFLQYSPYSYYSEHCIVIHDDHHPMIIDQKTFQKLLMFVYRFPHYFIGSNADLPIVGGSILSHEHYQGGKHHFPVCDAKVIHEFIWKDVTVQCLKWPLSVIRLKGEDPPSLIFAAERIWQSWQNYNNEKLDIICRTKDQHNTVTPIARKNGPTFELDMVLRNNRTSELHPDGIFHPHREYHHIKKENIGLIEVMGLAILPGRLQQEITDIYQYAGGEYKLNNLPEHLIKHKNFIIKIRELRKESGVALSDLIDKEIGRRFIGVLENCGVFKHTQESRAAFIEFTDKIFKDSD